MVDDDDPKLSVPAPEGVPADEPEPEAETEPEGDQPEGDDAEIQASADEDVVGADDEQDDEGEDDGDEEKSRKASRNTRYKRKAEHLAAQLEAERSRSNGSPPSDQAAIQRAFQQRVFEEIGEPPDPNDPKYKDNYVRFERETQAWMNDERQVSREVRKEFIGNFRREQERVGELVADHKERVARLRTKVKDFDVVMAKATVPVAPHVERLILDSKRSDRITWHLARDQSKLVKLNNMSSEAAAREIGRIEGRLSLPQPKQQTQARKPITPLRGGGASPPSELAEMNAYMKKQYGAKF